MSTAPRIRFVHRLEHALLRVAESLACALPAPLARGLGRGLGAAALRLGVRVPVARTNLRLAFPDWPAARIEAVVAETYAQLGEAALENLRFRRVDARALDRIADAMTGLEHVNEALARGKGAVLVTGHFGAFDLAGAAISHRAAPVHFLARGQTNPLVDRDLQERRAGLGVGVLRHGIGVREAFRVLHGNGCVAVVADQDAGRRGVFVDFLGRPASTPPGPAELCVRADAPLVLGYAIRLPGGGYAGRVFPPMDPPRTGNHAADVRTVTTWHVRALEEWIRAAPEQWLWTHRRWKTAPPAGVSSVRAGAPRAALGLALVLMLGAGVVLDRPASGANATPQGGFDGAGSSVIPLSAARVKRVFEGVRVRREKGGWAIEADEVFQAGVAPARAAMGLPDYRASVDSDSVATSTRGTVRDLSVTVDGLPMGVESLSGSAATSQNLGGIARVFRWEVPFAGEEIRTVHLAYHIGESTTDRDEPLLFFYLSPGALWEGETARVTVTVDLADVDPEDVIPGWVRPAGYHLYGRQLVWTGHAGDVSDIALAFRATGDPRAAAPDAKLGPLALSADGQEEWFQRLTVRDTRYWETFLRARRDTPVARWPRADRLLWDRLEARLADWQRALVPLGATPALTTH